MPTRFAPVVSTFGDLYALRKISFTHHCFTYRMRLRVKHQESGQLFQCRKMLSSSDGEYEFSGELAKKPPRSFARLPFVNRTDVDQAFEVVRRLLRQVNRGRALKSSGTKAFDPEATT